MVHFSTAKKDTIYIIKKKTNKKETSFVHLVKEPKK